MKLINYAKDQRQLLGVMSQNRIIDVASNWPGPNPPGDIVQVLRRGPDAMDTLAQMANGSAVTVPVDSVRVLAPIKNPGKIIALAGNYGKHVQESGLRLGLSMPDTQRTVPRPFIKPATTIADPDTVIQWPCCSREIDYEIELAAVIGKTAKAVEPEQGLDYVGGYTIINDISARSVTFKKDRQQRPWDEFFDWLNGKWADAFMPAGPWFVTADEVPEPQNLRLRTIIDGQVRQDASTAQMIFGVAEIVSFLSHIMTLEPGDIIATGTPEGVGMATGDYLRPGQAIKCQIDNLGTLENRMGKKCEKFYEPLARE